MKYTSALAVLLAFASARADTGTAQAVWTITSKGDDPGGFVYRIRFAPDGDLVVGGVFRGTFTFGGAAPLTATRISQAWIGRVSPDGAVRWVRALEVVPGETSTDRTLKGLAVTDDGSIAADVRVNDTVVRVTVTADGSTQKTSTLLDSRDANAQGTSIAGEDSLVVGTLGKKKPCGKAALAIFRVKPGGAAAWSACTKAARFEDQAEFLAVAPNGRSAACGGATILGVTADGKRAFEAIPAKEAGCDAVAISNAGQVSALLYNVGPETNKKTVLMTWAANGKPGWSKSCTDVVKGKGPCRFTALEHSGEDLMVALYVGAKSWLVRLDPKDGAIKSSTPVGTRVINVIAQRGPAAYIAGSSNELALARW